MMQFFTRAPDSPSTGSLVYAQSVLRFYYQYFLSGIVEIQPAPGEQFVVLIAEGTVISAYRFQDGCYHPFELGSLPELWSSGEAHVRSINLPRQAVRTSRCVLEWHPPAWNMELAWKEIPGLLDGLQQDKLDGLLHFLWEGGEAYLSLRDGELLPAETLFTTFTDVEAGAHLHRRLLNEVDGLCTVTCSQARPETLAYEQQAIRLGVGSWSRSFLERYGQLVGRSLSSSLSSEINGLMRSKSWYIQVVGDNLADTQVFPSLEPAVQAYQLLLRAANLHISKVLGTGFTTRMLSETFDSLEPRDQSAIIKYALSPVMSSN